MREFEKLNMNELCDGRSRKCSYGREEHKSFYLLLLTSHWTFFLALSSHQYLSRLLESRTVLIIFPSLHEGFKGAEEDIQISLARNAKPLKGGSAHKVTETNHGRRGQSRCF
jgi:hypothetical protein